MDETLRREDASHTETSIAIDAIAPDEATAAPEEIVSEAATLEESILKESILEEPILEEPILEKSILEEAVTTGTAQPAPSHAEKNPRLLAFEQLMRDLGGRIE